MAASGNSENQEPEIEKRYRSLIENSRDTIVILDRAGEILFANHVEEGYVMDEVLGSDAFAYLAGDSRDLLREAMRTTFEAGGSADCELVSEGGRQFRCRVAPVDAARVMVIASDISEFRKAEEDLRKSQRLLSAIVENIPHMIFVKDAESLRFVRLNEAGEELLGYRREDLLGKSDHDFFPPEEAEFFTTKDREVLLGGGVLDIPEETIETRQGKRMLHTKKVPLLSEEGEPQYLLGISEDITERRRAEEERRDLEAQVQRAQKLESLGLLAGGIAHDFNNLLTAILMNADLARRSVSTATRAAGMLDNILKSTQQAAALTRQMLAYAGKAAFSFKELDLNSVVTDTRNLLETSVSKKARLIYRLSDGLPAVRADPSQMQQIVMNLLLNASEALAKGEGEITLATSSKTCDRSELGRFELTDELPAGPYVTLAVSDDGCGMDAGTRAKVFDPFFSTKFAGRGLGLAAILGIVRGHKGGIRVESAPGKGTTFTILLPAIGEVGPPPASPRGEEEAWRGSGTILLVDDEDFLRTAATLALEELGFSVLTARDGHEALEVFREHQEEIRCVLLDLKMPRMDGEETFPELQRIRAQTPVILSSGYSERDSTRQFAGKGLAGFLQKPYAVTELRQKLRETLDR